MNKIDPTINNNSNDVSSAFHYCGSTSKTLALKDFSRQALRELLCQQNMIEINCRPGLIDFTQILELPEYWASISHTSPRIYQLPLHFAAAAVANKKYWGGIGIDVEYLMRPITSGAERHFLNPLDNNYSECSIWSDKNLSLSVSPLLLLWSKKEAAFKSLRTEQLIFKKTFNREMLLKDIWVEGNLFGLAHSPQLLLGEVGALEAFYFQPFILSLAHLYKSPLPKKARAFYCEQYVQD